MSWQEPPASNIVVQISILYVPLKKEAEKFYRLYDYTYEFIGAHCCCLLCMDNSKNKLEIYWVILCTYFCFIIIQVIDKEELFVYIYYIFLN